MKTFNLSETCSIDKNLSGIYSITNIRNGKRYLGSAQNFRRRFQEHSSRLRNNVHCNKHLQSAYNQDGASNFSFDILEIVINQSELIIREQKWIDSFDYKEDLYNFCPTAGSSLGRQVKEETKKKISDKNKLYERTKEHKAKISSALTGLKRSKESIQKTREKKFKAVIMCDKETGRSIKVFNSLLEAKNFLNLRDTTGITSALNGKMKTSAGYKWKYAK